MQNITHDYKIPDSPEINPDGTLARRTGRCGQRAALFVALANAAGLNSRIVIYRGHVSSEVAINDEWVDYDTTVPRHKHESELVAIIKKGPIYGYAYTPYYDKDWNRMPEPVLGQYSSWLSLLGGSANVILPRQLKYETESVLSDRKPNVIIRHDIDSKPDNILPMLHEENQLGIRSVIYVRTDNEEYDLQYYAPMLQMFEDEGFEIGLHITAVNRHGVTHKEAWSRYLEQLEKAEEYFTITTVQAHGYDDKYGIPEVTNYDVENRCPNGFGNLVSRTRRWKERLADSLGVMYPCDPLEWIPKLEKGGLYYCLWHPEFYQYDPPWVKYTGFMARPFTKQRLDESLVTLNRALNDTDYFNHANHPHLVATADYMRGKVRRSERVIDLACGWGLLNILIRSSPHLWSRIPDFAYVGIESSFDRMKAAQKLHMMLKMPLPLILYGDLLDPSGKGLVGEWVVLLGWEGDIKTSAALDCATRYLADHGRLLTTYIDKDQFNAMARSPNWARLQDLEYCLLSQEDLQLFADRNNLRIVDQIKGIYRNKFPRHLAIFERN